MPVIPEPRGPRQEDNKLEARLAVIPSQTNKRLHFSLSNYKRILLKIHVSVNLIFIVENGKQSSL